MSSTLSVNGIGHGILRAPTLRLGGATAKPTAEDEAAKVEQAKKSKGIGKPNPLNQIKDQAEADAAPASEKGSTGNKTLDSLQKAIDMAKRQLELAQKQLRAVEARSKGEGKADEASQAAREAAQANCRCRQRGPDDRLCCLHRSPEEGRRNHQRGQRPGVMLAP